MSEQFILEYTNDNIESIVNNRYPFYLNEIRGKSILINGVRIGWKTFPLIDNKDGTYFHLITKDYLNNDGFCCPNLIIRCDKDFSYNPMMSEEIPDNKKRTLCGHRIQCLSVIPRILNTQNSLIWQRSESTPKGRRTRIKVLNKENKYFMVFDKRNNGSILYWTSYPVNDQKIEKFEKEYHANFDPQNPIIIEIQ